MILMVAITVILAAVIAASVLGLVDTNDLAPQVTFDYDYNETSNNLTVTATGGEQFDPGAVNVTGDPGDANGVDANDTYGEITDNSPSGLPDGEQISAGDDFTVAVKYPAHGGAELRRLASPRNRGA
jgi:FlaG/FlaF family flagellin (archaellin)